MRTHLAAGVALVIALVASVGGGGGLGTWPLLVYQSALLVAALLVACLPGSRPLFLGASVAVAGLALSLAALASAATARYPFASILTWTNWSSALLAGWVVVVLTRACGNDGGSEEPQAFLRTLTLAAVTGVLILQLLARMGPPLAFERAIEGRFVGTFADPNHLVALLLVMAVLVARGIAGGGWRSHAAAVLLLCCVIPALISGSRIAALAILLGFAGELLRRRRSGRLLPWSPRLRAFVLGASLLALLGVALLGTATVSRRTTETEAWTRPRIWAAAAPAALERPVLGLGPGAFAHAWQRYNFANERGLSRYGQRVTTPHGEWLRLPIELGLLGCAALVLLLGRFAAALRARGALAEAAPLAGVLLPLVLVHDVFHAPALGAWIALAAAISLVTASPEPRGSEALVDARHPARSASLLIALAVATAALVIRPALADLAVKRAASASGQAAVAAWSEALGLSPGQPYTWARLSQVVAPEGSAPQPRALLVADGLLEEGMRRAPRLPELLVQRAGLAGLAARGAFPDAGTVETAAALWSRAAALAPFNAPLSLRAAADLLALGAPVSAAAHAHHVVELEPHSLGGRMLEIVALSRAGRSDELPSLRLALERERALALVPATDYERLLMTAPQALLDEALVPP